MVSQLLATEHHLPYEIMPHDTDERTNQASRYSICLPGRDGRL